MNLINNFVSVKSALKFGAVIKVDKLIENHTGDMLIMQSLLQRGNPDVSEYCVACVSL